MHTSRPSQTSAKAVRPAPTLRWATAATLGAPLVGVALAADDKGQVYAVGGYNGAASVRTVRRVVPTAGVTASLPARSHDAAVGFIGDTMYVFGGGQSESYDTIVRIRGGQARIIGRLARPLSDAVCVPYTYRGVRGLLLVGGYDGSAYRREVTFVAERGDGLSFTTLFELPGGVRYPAVATSQGRLFIAGGLSPTGPVSDIWTWSPTEPRLRRLARLPVPLYQAAAFANSSWLFVAGGLTQGERVLSQVYAIGIDTGQVVQAGTTPTPVADMGYTQVGNTGYLAGGMSSHQASGYRSAVYMVDLSSDQ